MEQTITLNQFGYGAYAFSVTSVLMKSAKYLYIYFKEIKREVSRLGDLSTSFGSRKMRRLVQPGTGVSRTEAELLEPEPKPS